MKEDKWLCSFCHQQNAVDIGVQDLRVILASRHKLMLSLVYTIAAHRLCSHAMQTGTHCHADSMCTQATLLHAERCGAASGSCGLHSAGHDWPACQPDCRDASNPGGHNSCSFRTAGSKNHHQAGASQHYNAIECSHTYTVCKLPWFMFNLISTVSVCTSWLMRCAPGCKGGALPANHHRVLLT